MLGGVRVVEEGERNEGSRGAISQTVRVITEALSSSAAFRQIDERLFVVKQGSAYVMITVQPLGRRRALVRLAAQVVAGVTMTGELARALLRYNARLRFGAFGYSEAGRVVTLSHAILGGEGLGPDSLLAALEDLALLADEVDDKLVAAGGGSRMEDLLADELEAQTMEDLLAAEASATLRFEEALSWPTLPTAEGEGAKDR